VIQVEQLLRDVATVRDEVFGLNEYRPGQQAAIETILSGRDLLAVMPTGAGKSLCFQAPSVARPGLTLVISPLIALMKDQVDGLQARNVRASYLASGQPAEERRAVWRDVRGGELDLLYVSPERLRDQGFIDLITRANVWFVAVDEAHCISTWGSDFRPDYLRIPEAIRRLPKRPVIAAFTATATPMVQNDLVEKLELREPGRVLAGFDRPNLRFLVEYCANPSIRLDELVRQVSRRKGTGIVYAGTRRAAEEQAEFLSQHGRKALPYHAGLSSSARTAAQAAFMSGAIEVICATNAFGLGIDKPDVRFVIHTALPSSPDAYYQEAGRAGRDGLPADALMLSCESDRGLQEWMIDVDMPDANVLMHVFRYVGRCDERISIEKAASDLRLSTTTLRVSLQMLGEAGALELGDRVGQEQFASTAVEALGRRHMAAIEESMARQRAWRLEQLDEIEGYVQSSRCRRAYLLRYFGDPGATDRGDARCCDRCASPGTRSAGDLARQARATRLKKPRRISAARAAVRDALVETGTVRGAAAATGQPAKKIAEIAREMVSTGVLDIDALVPADVQAELADACKRMADAGIDYRRPRPGYLQAAMQFCPPGTNWDQLALYLASLRRKDKLEELADIEPEIVVAESRPVRVRSSKASWHETLELFQAARSIDEIAEERELKTVTVEGHLIEAVRAGKLDPQRLVDPETAALVRRAIEDTPPSDTPLRDIRARANALAGREIPYLAINAVREQIVLPSDSPEVRHLLERKARAEALRRERSAAGESWPDAWESEYERILARLAELGSPQ
jgi:RecQ family ATP-dependent DNA helicase